MISNISRSNIPSSACNIKYHRYIKVTEDMIIVMSRR